MALIRIEGLVKRYPRSRSLGAFLRRPFERKEITALRGVDLELPPGRIYGLVGRNGAGKTTLLKTLAGLVLPSEGRAMVGDLDVENAGRALRDRVGLVVADERSFYWRLSVRENLRFYAVLERLHGSELSRRIAACIEQVELEDYADVAFRELSTGLRQRLAIARGLLSDPEVLLMDEATRSLDPAASRDVRERIRTIAKERDERLVIYSTHTLSEVEDLCDEVIVLQGGRVVAREDLHESSRGTNLYRVTSRRPVSPGLLNEIPGVTELRCDGNSIDVELESKDRVDAIIDKVRGGGYGLDALSPIPRRLEDLITRPMPVDKNDA